MGFCVIKLLLVEINEFAYSKEMERYEMKTNNCPKVSVIIPVYNVELYLADCLDSVINQTLRELEIICVNDGSTDNSLAILRKYQEADKRIEIIDSFRNGGQSHARNQGINKARGEYIYFLDSDDMIVPEAMEELYLLSKRENLDIVYFDTYLKFETEQLASKFYAYKAERNAEYPGIYQGEALFAEFIKNEDWVASPPRQFFKFEFLFENKLNFYEGILHEDELFTFLSILKANRAMCIKKKYFIRRFRDKSIMTTQVSKINFIGLFTCYCEMFLFWHTMKLNEVTNTMIDVHLARLYKSIIISYKKNKLFVELPEIKNANKIVQHLFEVFLENIHQGRICRQLAAHKLELIKQQERIIVYGAGVVAREVLHILDESEIGIYGFAVSNKEGNPKYIMGTKVYGIEELTEFRKDSMVLVAISYKHQKSIIEKLNELGFEKVIEVL